MVQRVTLDMDASLLRDRLFTQRSKLKTKRRSLKETLRGVLAGERKDGDAAGAAGAARAAVADDNETGAWVGELEDIVDGIEWQSAAALRGRLMGHEDDEEDDADDDVANAAGGGCGEGEEAAAATQLAALAAAAHRELVAKMKTLKGSTRDDVAKDIAQLEKYQDRVNKTGHKLWKTGNQRENLEARWYMPRAAATALMHENSIGIVRLNGTTVFEEPKPTCLTYSCPPNRFARTSLSHLSSLDSSFGWLRQSPPSTASPCHNRTSRE
jgi:hypothetical protein